MELLYSLILIFIGLAGGIAVGSGFVAFITVLDIVPRLVQMTKAHRFIRGCEYSIVLGVLFFTWIDFRGWEMGFPDWATIPLGLTMGIFVGLLAAALTEVINVLPILAKRLRMQEHLLYLLMAMALGKVAGSIYQWMVFRVW
ncbi:stage V sporulation protein AB [Lihuaxuella thermophila]|uniref:Stage V sporulation protein AB n=1 Tax=Lihuaxuella thermophila TaxID=1173111 RepID=A0A1H8EN20_9BACL|nr:stage V sporulation protein AB [Lihuaxuella thermophila]SEN20514.1 stage V sporulation protein AB [Lihuaxuella thermophila]